MGVILGRASANTSFEWVLYPLTILQSVVTLLQGRIGKENYAIFQSSPFFSFDHSNKQDLLEELKLLVLGQYFVDMMYQHIEELDTSGVREMFPGASLFNWHGISLMPN